ncbi:MAG: SCO family protein [Alphaproteobacteria bacterium]|nr:SCO family protein [Alphaproteobacteria bacterium]
MVRVGAEAKAAAGSVARLIGLFAAVALVWGAPAGAADPTPPPFDLGGPFALVDHHGNTVTDRDFHGDYLLVFFGYANCPGICSAALPAMGAAVDAIEAAASDQVDRVQPVMITIAPDLDQPEPMRRVLAQIHPRLLGLTGTPEALEEARRAYQVSVEYIGEDITGVPIYSHGSYIYLMGPDGKLQTLIPPILTPEQIAGIVANYLDAPQS